VLTLAVFGLIIASALRQKLRRIETRAALNKTASAVQAGLPIVTFNVPTLSTPHSILSPGETAATPAGVPVMMMSPAPISTCCDSFQMISGTLQISSERSPFCRSVPLTDSQILPFEGWPILAAG
jgi:hypothetical protein